MNESPTTPGTVRRRIGDPGGADTPTGYGGDRLRTIADRHPAPSATAAATTVDDPPVIDDTPTDRTAVEPELTEAPVAEVPVVEKAVVDAPAVDEPVAEQPIVGEPVAGGAPSEETRSAGTDAGHRRPSLWQGLGAALVVVLVVAVILLGLQVRHQSDVNSLRSSALSTGKADGVLLSSYDYRNLTGPGSAWSKVEQNATPTFRRGFLSTSGSVGKLLTQYHATATGKIVNVGVATFSSSRAVILLFIDQTVKNTVQKSSTSTQPLRSELTLVRSGGKWLINNLTVPS